MLSSTNKRPLEQVAVIDAFLAYRDALRDSLLTRAEVIGLVFVGSAADVSRADRWSDHDFFVITKPGYAQLLRNDLSWLPEYQNIAMATPETEHGLKVVYQNGHVLEFAVFNDEELELAGGNAYEVFIDREAGNLGTIAERMAKLVERSKPSAFNLNREFELFLEHLIIGVGRARRGEILIARQQIGSYALNHVLGLIRHCVAPLEGTLTREDNLSRYRRFEQQYPEIGARIEILLRAEVGDCAKGLLELVLTCCAAFIDDSKLAQVSVVRSTLEWS